MTRYVDLHTHSTASDGSHEPGEVVRMALEKGLAAIALTDHDSVSGVEKAQAAAEGKDIEVIAGVELSAADDPGRGLIDVHIVGLFVDPGYQPLREALEKKARAKNEKSREQVALIEASGLKLPYADVQKEAKGDTVRRPHLWAVLERENPGKVRREEFFHRTRMGGDWFVGLKHDLTLEKCVRLIKASGGVPILAHPGCYNRLYEKDGTIIDPRTKGILEVCAGAGVQGVEVFYNYVIHGPYRQEDGTSITGSQQQELKDYYGGLADEHGLLWSGGSDFHGKALPWIRLGDAGVPYDILQKMRDCV